MPKIRKYWSFVVYPESAPVDWKKRLEDTGAPCAVSPLHSGDDECKKEHYHVLLGFKRGVGMSTARSVCDVCGGANGFVQEVFAPAGAYEYLTHKNNPEKEQFGDSLPELFNGFHRPFVELDDDEVMAECIDLVFEYNILEFNQLCNYFRQQGQTEKANWVVRHAYGLKALIDSLRFSKSVEHIERANEAVKEVDKARKKGFVTCFEKTPFDDEEGFGDARQEVGNTAN